MHFYWKFPMTIMYLCALNIKEIANPKEYYWPLWVVYQLNFAEQTITDHEYRKEAPCLLLITVYKISPTDDCNLLQFHSDNNNYIITCNSLQVVLLTPLRLSFVIQSFSRRWWVDNELTAPIIHRLCLLPLFTWLTVGRRMKEKESTKQPD